MSERDAMNLKYLRMAATDINSALTPGTEAYVRRLRDRGRSG